MLQSYLSPARYLAGGYGADTSGMTQAAVRNVLVRATSRVNRYCNAPKLPSPFDFRGGAMIDEMHQWPIVNSLAYGPGARRVYVNATPLRTVTALSIQLGVSPQITIDPSDQLFVNTMEGYAEIVALTPTIVGTWPLALQLGLYQPLARISYTYGRTFPVVGDVLEAESPTLYTASHGNWSSTIAPTVYVDGVEIDPTDYAINYDDGSVTFDDAAEPAVQSEVSADYTYLLDDAIAQATGVVATNLLGARAMASRGMLGLQSLRVAEVALSAMSPRQMVTKNGATIPAEAAEYLDGFVFGSVA